MTRYTVENTSGRNVTVFLDGNPVEDVVEADDDLGFVVVTARDERGKIILEGDDVKRKLLTGVVRVTMSERV